jgi:hypothetical protein
VGSWASQPVAATALADNAPRHSLLWLACSTHNITDVACVLLTQHQRCGLRAAHTTSTIQNSGRFTDIDSDFKESYLSALLKATGAGGDELEFSEIEVSEPATKPCFLWIVALCCFCTQIICARRA